MITDAYAERKAIDVYKDTWGHLAPNKNMRYKARIVFAIGCYESGYLNPTPICVEIEDLHDSPWLYEDVIDYLHTIGEMPEGTIWEFDGYYENRIFEGNLSLLLNTNR